LSINTGTQKEN